MEAGAEAAEEAAVEAGAEAAEEAAVEAGAEAAEEAAEEAGAVLPEAQPQLPWWEVLQCSGSDSQQSLPLVTMPIGDPISGGAASVLSPWPPNPPPGAAAAATDAVATAATGPAAIGVGFAVPGVSSSFVAAPSSPDDRGRSGQLGVGCTTTVAELGVCDADSLSRPLSGMTLRGGGCSPTYEAGAPSTAAGVGPPRVPASASAEALAAAAIAPSQQAFVSAAAQPAVHTFSSTAASGRRAEVLVVCPPCCPPCPAAVAASRSEAGPLLPPGALPLQMADPRATPTRAAALSSGRCRSRSFDGIPSPPPPPVSAQRTSLAGHGIRGP